MKTKVIMVVAMLAVSQPAFALEMGPGSTRKEVYQALGKPNGKAMMNGVVVLFYDGGPIEMRNGRVTRIDSDFGKRPAPKPAPPAKTSLLPKKLAFLSGFSEWVDWFYEQITVSKKNSRASAAGTPVEAGLLEEPAVKKISNGGQEVRLDHLLVPGKVTVLDFYAEWCAPCTKMSPLLEAVASRDAELFLRKVDIVRWDTQIAKQYEIDSVPNLRVYNRHGQMIGTPTSDFEQVTQYIAMAR